MVIFSTLTGVLIYALVNHWQDIVSLGPWGWTILTLVGIKNLVLAGTSTVRVMDTVISIHAAHPQLNFWQVLTHDIGHDVKALDILKYVSPYTWKQITRHETYGSHIKGLAAFLPQSFTKTVKWLFSSSDLLTPFFREMFGSSGRELQAKIDRTDAAIKDVRRISAEIRSQTAPVLDGPHEEHDIVFERLKAVKDSLPAGRRILILNFDVHSDKYGHSDNPSSYSGTWAQDAEDKGWAYVMHFPPEDQFHFWNKPEMRKKLLQEINALKEKGVIHDIWCTIDYDFFAEYFRKEGLDLASVSARLTEITGFLKDGGLWPSHVITAISRYCLPQQDKTPQKQIDLITEAIRSSFAAPEAQTAHKPGNPPKDMTKPAPTELDVLLGLVNKLSGFTNQLAGGCLTKNGAMAYLLRRVLGERNVELIKKECELNNRIETHFYIRVYGEKEKYIVDIDPLPVTNGFTMKGFNPAAAHPEILRVVMPVTKAIALCDWYAEEGEVISDRWKYGEAV